MNNGVPAADQPAVASRVYPVAIQGSGTGSLQASGSVAGYQNQSLPSAGLLTSPAASNDVVAADADLEMQKRLDQLMLRHTQRAVLNNGQGMASFARLSNYDIQGPAAKK
ncbi:hypothetical protein [Oceanicoccus sp. KOV_DT_Chl]|uniref:hypothetical protein n=1 Tax=Oceanicoccus sp. KOV_DT_Chl TaxID=1904639 RepID=UPI000C7BBA59|nr:hypothetical protein [Oceanicoccus sp. KOV_DT_Chl]